MSDNVYPCPHCQGTGEVRAAWYTVTTYQDERVTQGPMRDREAAQRLADELNAEPEPRGYIAHVEWVLEL